MKRKVNVGEVLEEEINTLRELMKVAMEKKDESITVSERNNLIKTISQASGTLGQLLKIQNEMDRGDGGSAAILKQALDELEEEWPEFKRLVAKYYPDQAEKQEE